MNSTLKTNLLWIIGLLVLVIIGLVAVKWSEITNLNTLLNFGMGLTSVVLAIIAIIYGFIANNSFSGTVAKIESSAEQITRTVGEVPAKLNSIERAMGETKESLTGTLSKFESAARDIMKTVSTIPEQLSALETKTDAVHKRLTEASSQVQPPSNSGQSQPVDKPAFEKFANDAVQYFLTTSSWNGLKIMYIARFFCAKKALFSLREICRLDSSMSFDYALGYFVAASSCGFFAYSGDAQKGDFGVTSMHEMVASKIMPAIEARLKFVNEQTRVEFQKQWDSLNGYLTQKFGKLDS